MDEEQIKQLFKDELKELKEGLKVFAKAEDIQKEIQKLETKIEESGITDLKASIDELKEAGEQQGLAIQEMKEAKINESKKSIDQLLTENIDSLKAMVDDGQKSAVIKDVTTSNFSNDVANYTAPGVAQVQRGMPWIRDLFNVVTLVGDTHGEIDWWEQETITNNASNVAEGAASGSQSDIEWVRKTLTNKRVHDYIKVSKSRLKDVSFMAGEIQRLIDRNMRLKENSQLLNGLGTGNEIKGILRYAQDFDTDITKIANANLNDLVGKIRTQIRKNSKDGFLPNYHVSDSDLLDLVRYAKDDIGQYVFPRWAQGDSVTMGGMNAVENNLIDSNFLLVGDFSLGTVYVWDGLEIEIGYIDKDFINGMVTISARLRENLKVADNDVEGFVKVTDVASTIAAINEVVG